MHVVSTASRDKRCGYPRREPQTLRPGNHDLDVVAANVENALTEHAAAHGERQPSSVAIDAVDDADPTALVVHAETQATLKPVAAIKS